MFCPKCGEAVDREEMCAECGACEDCCDARTAAAEFDADEFGEEPEDEYERRTRG